MVEAHEEVCFGKLSVYTFIRMMEMYSVQKEQEFI